MTQQPAPAQAITDAQSNWDLLRKILTQDIARYQAMSSKPTDHWGNRAFDFELVLASMDGLEYPERYVPGLAEHTEAACNTITRAAR